MDLIIMGAIVVGLTQAFKKGFKVSARFIPLVALAITFAVIGIYCFSEGVSLGWKAIENGFVVALTSVGLFSTVKNTFKSNG